MPNAGRMRVPKPSQRAGRQIDSRSTPTGEPIRRERLAIIEGCYVNRTRHGTCDGSQVRWQEEREKARVGLEAKADSCMRV